MSINVTKRERSFKYVETYEKIMNIIKKSKLQSGDMLPSENQLCKEFDVSRGTIRQAIALLREDGIIYNHQGKGNIIADKKSEKFGLEKVNIPIFNFNNLDYSKVELNIEFQPASRKMKEFLEVDDNIIVMLVNAKYFIKNDVAALLMYFINYEDVKQYDLNIQNEKDLKKLVDVLILKNVSNSELEFQSFHARESVAKKMNMEVGTNIIYFSEVMRKQNKSVVFYRRSYFRPNYFTFRINRT